MASQQVADVRNQAVRKTGLPPEMLLAAGILSNPDTPEGAYKRARGLVEQGHYTEAKSLLHPHANATMGGLQSRILELLGVCAGHCGGDWADLLGRACAGYRQAGDVHGVARVMCHMGELQLEAGQFREANRSLRLACQLFLRAGQRAAAALAKSLGSRLRLRAGRIEMALAMSDQALAELGTIDNARIEGVVRLDRARILAHMRLIEPCAKELILAERKLAASGNRAERLRSRLVRAETLFVLGEGARAVSGLRRLWNDVSGVEDVLTRAHLHELLGKSLVGENPSDARRLLLRAKNLYEGISSRYGVAACELALTQVEERLGLAVENRLQAMTQLPLNDWRLFAQDLRLVQAARTVPRDADLARRMIFEVREFGAKSKNPSLIKAAERALQNTGLVALADLTPMRALSTLPRDVSVTNGERRLLSPLAARLHRGANEMSNVRSNARPRKDLRPRASAHPFQRSVTAKVERDRHDPLAHQSRAERLVGRNIPLAPDWGLKPPKPHVA